MSLSGLQDIEGGECDIWENIKYIPLKIETAYYPIFIFSQNFLQQDFDKLIFFLKLPFRWLITAK